MPAARRTPLGGGSVADISATASWPDDPRLVAALEEYMALERAGSTPDRSVFLARHPEVAGLLAECLAGLEFVRDAAGALADGADSPAHSPLFAELADGLEPGAVLGEFRIVREAGRGGMGVVYEAEQLGLNRRVALKVLPLAAALDPRQRQRFQVEAQAAALLQQEHIVPVYGVGCDRGIAYYAMQFIAGRSLADWIAEQRGLLGPPPSGSGSRNRADFRLAAGWGLHAAEALEHAHGIGVLHRDVKPSNLLVDDRGHLWITDFGLARFVQDDDPTLTRTGDLVGTLRYMSPEQLRGDRAVVDHRCDVYALGASLYELLTLRPAFDGRDRSEILQRILHDEPPAPRRIDPAIPRDLETIVLKAMAKEPAPRYASARAMAEDLRRFLDDQPILARRPGLPERSLRWARRHRNVLATAVGVLLLSMAVGALLLWQSNVSLRVARSRERQAFERTFAAMDLITFPLMGKAAVAGLLQGQEGEQIYRSAISFYDDITKFYADSDTMSELAAKSSRRAGYLRMIIREPQRARADYDLSVSIFERIARKHPDYIWLYTGAIETLSELAAFQGAPPYNDRAGADASIRRAVGISVGLLDNPQAALPCFSQALIEAFNGISWALGLKPDTDPVLARDTVRMMEKAVEWNPTNGAIWNTLGLARFRAGQLDAADKAIHRSMVTRAGGDPYDWLVMAMIDQRRGRPEEASRWFDRCEPYMKQHPGMEHSLDYVSLRAEAARELGRVGAQTAPQSLPARKIRPAGSPPLDELLPH